MLMLTLKLVCRAKQRFGGLWLMAFNAARAVEHYPIPKLEALRLYLLGTYGHTDPPHTAAVNMITLPLLHLAT